MSYFLCTNLCFAGHKLLLGQLCYGLYVPRRGGCTGHRVGCGLVTLHHGSSRYSVKTLYELTNFVDVFLHVSQVLGLEL